MPCSSLSFSSLLTEADSLTSPTNLHALASAAGPVYSGSISRALHSELQQPHIMHFWLLSIAFSCSLVTATSPAPSSGTRYGETFSIFSQKGSKSTTRSLATRWFLSGPTTMSPIFLNSGRTCVLQARRENPFTSTAQEPHMAERQDLRKASVGSCSSAIFIRASSTVMPSATSTMYACMYGSADSPEATGLARFILNFIFMPFNSPASG